MNTRKEVKIAKSFAWRRILLVFAIASSLIGVFILVPVITHEIKARKAERIRRIHAEGLIPCGPDERAFGSADSELLEQLPAMPTLSITAYPSFDDISSVHLVGRDLYYIRRERPVWMPQSQSVGPRVPKVVEIKKARVPSSVSVGLTELIENDIAHAAAEWPMGLDGTTYYFDTPAGCAAAWSPDGETRAGKIVDLFWDLVMRVKGGGPLKEEESDAVLLRKMGRLRL